MKKYNFKNIFLSCLLLLLTLVLVACSKSYTVKFVDYDGTILKTETVKEGGAATAPENPVHDDYEFVTWDKDFSIITEDLTVKAVYLGTALTENLKMDFSFANKEFKKDDYVVVDSDKGIQLAKVRYIKDRVDEDIDEVKVCFENLKNIV
mgnify:CR=1 FL=1